VLNNAASNTAVGAAALLLNTTGTQNTATGTDAMVYNDSGNNNTANGAFSLFYNLTGGDNTAVGYQALYYNDFSGSGMGEQNTAFGNYALWFNGDGQWNCAFGYNALTNNDTGTVNTAFGHEALFSNVGGFYNTAVGRNALGSVDNDDNTAIGWWAGSDLDGAGNICIGSSVYGLAGEDGVTRIGDGKFSGYNACYITGIFGTDVNVKTAALVYVDDTGKLGTVPMAAGAKNMAVPVPRGAHPQAMLNESEHRKVAQLQATIAELKSTVAQQRKDFEAIVARQQKATQALAEQVKEQAAQIQKVSAQLEMSQPATTVVANKP
jgi:hypothetical protein